MGNVLLAAGASAANALYSVKSPAVRIRDAAPVFLPAILIPSVKVATVDENIGLIGD
jgi:hypothetical protein